MKKLFLLLFLINTHIFAQSILIINSYHKGYEWSDSVISGIEEVFYKNKNIETNILYMDSKRVTSKKYYENLKNLYKVQLENKKFDLIIAVDRFAYDFVLNIYKDFFTKEPILAVGIENFSKQKAKSFNIEDKVSALLERRDLKSNIRLGEILLPTINKAYVINDKSLNAQHTEPLIKELFESFHNRYPLEYIKENTLKDLEKRFSLKEEGAIVLFVRFYKSSSGKLYKNHEIEEFIKKSKLPVFITDSLFVNKGAVGGRIVNLKSMGEESALMALDILDGSKPRVVVYDKLEYIFDAQKLDEFTLAVGNQLPFRYEIVNKRKTFYDKHTTLINFVFTITPFLVLLILGLIHNLYFRKKVEKSLRHRIDFDELLLNSIESPIFWQNEKGIILEVNKGFCSLLSKKQEEIIGKKLEDINSSNALNLKKVIERGDKQKNILFKYVDEKKQKYINLIKQAHFYDETHKVTGSVTILTDITKERKLQKQREKEQQFIMQQSKLAEIGEIFSSIAHQWKAPLVEITTIAQESFYLCDTSSADEKESYVSEMMTQVNYMNDTINNFQKFIIPSNKKNIFDVKEAIKEILGIAEHSIKYNYIDVNIDVKENTNLNVLGYKNEFMQAFLNIINNSKDEFNKQKTQNRKIDVNIFNKQNALVLTIEDNAGGIKLKNIDRIFNQYFSTKEEGHGIGLYMVKMIIEDKMNGRVSVSNKRKGACFTIILGLSK